MDNTMNIDDLIEQYNTTIKEMQEKMQASFKEIFSNFWKDNPKVKAVVWSQYTPYFNDGDACEFRVYDMYIATAKALKELKDGDINPYDLDCLIDYDYDAYIKSTDKSREIFEFIMKEYADEITLEEARKAISILQSIKKIPDEVFENMFGDHVLVIATPEGFEVEEYEHD